MSRAWLEQRERGSAAALAIIYWIGTSIGRSVARAFLLPITAYYLVVAGEARRSSRQYLRRILGHEPGWRDVFRHIHCFASTILDRVYLLAGQFDRFDIRIHGGELILSQAASGRGCLILGAHLGSFEVLRAIGATEQLPLKVLMNVAHNSSITRFFNALNPQISATIIPIDGPNTLLAVKEKLEEGYLIGALGDRVVSRDKVVRCRFLDGQADFPAGPLLLAARLRCPVVLGFGLYRGGNRYDVHFEQLADSLPISDRRSAEAIAPWVQAYADRLAAYTRKAPRNWFNFYDFWGDERTLDECPEFSSPVAKETATTKRRLPLSAKRGTADGR